MTAAAILRNPKSRYLGSGLTDRHEIWRGDAIRHLWYVPQVVIWWSIEGVHFVSGRKLPFPIDKASRC